MAKRLAAKESGPRARSSTHVTSPAVTGMPLENLALRSWKTMVLPSFDTVQRRANPGRGSIEPGPGVLAEIGHVRGLA